MGKKQRVFTAEYKARVALEAIKGQSTVAQIASQFEVHTTQITMWKKRAIVGLVGLFKKGAQNGKEDSQVRMDKLYQEIGKLQVENAFLKKAVYRDTM